MNKAELLLKNKLLTVPVTGLKNFRFTTKIFILFKLAAIFSNG